MPSDEVDELCINTIRMLSIDAVQRARSGHPGMPMGAATMAYILWTRHLRHNPQNPSWPDRDRFVLSAGHGSMLLYSLLFLTGYDLTMADIRQFRQWNSRTELFDRQPDSYRDTVLPPSVRARVSIEAASPFGWERYVGLDGAMIGVGDFGASAPGPVMMREFGFTTQRVVELAKRILGREIKRSTAFADS